MKFSKKKSGLKGFTLIEMLVVVLIIGILASVALPAYEKAVKRTRVSQIWPLLKIINEAEQAKNMEQGTFNQVYPMDELDITIDSTALNELRAKGIQISVMDSNTPNADLSSPAQAYWCPSVSDVYQGDVLLYFANGKRHCVGYASNSKGEDTALCEIALDQTSSISACITDGDCFTE